MNTHKPEPLYPTTPGKTCPVCGKRAYSAGGIHPQCAVKQADEPRKLKLAAEKKKLAQRLAEQAARG